MENVKCFCSALKINKYSLNRNCDKPRLIEALKTKRIRDIACGSSHSAAITSSGELYSWGLGEYGRLGHGDNTTQLRPKLVRDPLHWTGDGIMIDSDREKITDEM